MSKTCSHLGTIRKVKPSARLRGARLKTGSEWVHQNLPDVRARCFLVIESLVVVMQPLTIARQVT